MQGMFFYILMCVGTVSSSPIGSGNSGYALKHPSVGFRRD